jgi:hypothetical protein
MIDPELAKAAEAIEADGVQRFGKDNWPTLVGAINKSIPKGVDPADVLKAAIASGDPAKAIERAGREALANLGSAGDREAEAAYSALRAKDRESYRRQRGLIR